jgi:hypothetical protein
MGQDAATTVREIADIRPRMDTDMRELERRMPEPARMKRLAGMVAGGGAAALVAVALVRRARDRRRANRMVEVVPAPALRPAVDEGEWKRWALVAGGVWLAVRLIELRQLRRVNRTSGA